MKEREVIECDQIRCTDSLKYIALGRRDDILSSQQQNHQYLLTIPLPEHPFVISPKIGLQVAGLYFFVVTIF